MIANEFGEAASDPIHRAALIAAGLVLFVLTLVDQRDRRAIVRARRACRAGRRRGRGRSGRVSAMPGAGRSQPTSPSAQRADQADARAARRWRPLVALVPLVLVLYYLIKKGLGAGASHFFTTDPTGNFLGDPGGIKSAMLGTIEIVPRNG